MNTFFELIIDINISNIIIKKRLNPKSKTANNMLNHTLINPKSLLTKMFFIHHLQHNTPLFKFSKIIKLAPLTTKQTQQSHISEKLIKSLNSAKDIFKQFSSRPLAKTYIQPQQHKKTAQQTNNILQQQTQQQSHIQFINSLNQHSIETKLIRSPQFNVSKLIKRIKDQKILQSSIECLINQRSFHEKQKTYVTNVFSILSQLFKKNILEGRKGDLDVGYFKEFMQLFNQYFILMHMQPKLLINYLFLVNHLIKTKTVDSSRAYFVNQKIVIDYILQNRSKFNIINKKQLLTFFTYLSVASVIANYPQRYYEFVDFLLEKLDYSWFNENMYRNRRFVTALYGLNYRSRKVVNGLREIMGVKEINQGNVDVVVLALNAYINLDAKLYVSNDNNDNKSQQQYPQQITKPLNKIVQFIKRMKQKSSSSLVNKDTTLDNIQLQIYKTLIPTMFRSSIWLPAFWLQFAQWLDKQKNYLKMPVIQIYTIMDLLQIDKDIIPKQVSQRLLQSKQSMLVNNNFRIQDVDLIKVYHTQFGSRQRQFFTSQQQIANNLRSVSGINIKTQSLIHFFLVDILMNGDTIIEINNQMHYVMDQGQKGKVANIKSAFRKRILQKLGYKFMEFEVDMFVEGNYQFLKLIQKEFYQKKKTVTKTNTN